MTPWTLILLAFSPAARRNLAAKTKRVDAARPKVVGVPPIESIPVKQLDPPRRGSLAEFHRIMAEADAKESARRLDDECRKFGL